MKAYTLAYLVVVIIFALGVLQITGRLIMRLGSAIINQARKPAD